MSSELCEEISLVQQRVDEVGVVLERCGQCRVDDLQNHSDHLLQHIQIC